MDEEDKFLVELKDKVKKAVNKTIERYGFDSISVEVNVWKLGLDYKPYKKIELINELKKNCEFCGKETLYYDSKEQKYLCVDCYAKLKGEKHGE